jgi:hypothetical protein
MQNSIASFFTKRSPLEQYRRNVTSQKGEDGVIEYIVKVLEPPNKYCVEFGAWDGRQFSNCFNLLQNHGWSGLLLEANEEIFGELVKTYAQNENVRLGNKYVNFEGPDRLDAILADNGVPALFGVLSIDIDGCDYYVWESLEKFSPELVIIEFNPTVPNDVIFVQEKSFDVNQGCSLLALVILGKKKGYELAVCTDFNAFFVKAEKLASLGVTDNFISILYSPPLNGRIFQGYDNTIHVVGMNQMFWHGGLRVRSEDFQVLPKSMRVWKTAPKKPK